MNVKRILVAFGRDPLDGSILLQLRRMALAFAPQEIHAVTVVKPDAPIAEGPDELAQRMENEVRTTLPAESGARLRTAVLNGSSVLDALLAYLERHPVDVVVVGHRRGGKARALGRRLARHAPCAVWMLPDGLRPEVHRVLVPVDFSAAACAALDTALAVCRAYGLAECHVLHVMARQSDEDAVARGAETAELERMLAERDLGGVKVVTITQDAEDVAGGVRAVAGRSGADLVIMGARGRSRAAAVLLGSATEDVLDASPCAVLVVRAPGRPLSLLDVVVERVFTGERPPGNHQ